MSIATPEVESLQRGLLAIACVLLSIHVAHAAERGRQPPALFEAPAAAPLAQNATGRRPPGVRVDTGVVPAGGAHAGPCARCSRHACPRCRLPAEHAGLHGHCQHGLCPAHCPVHPEVFGFYGTQWRKWPGAAAVRTSFQEEATPVRPPRSAVPQATEESLEEVATPVRPPRSAVPKGAEESRRPPDPAADGEAGTPMPVKPDAAAEDPPPGTRGRDEGKKAPLPRPSPQADDGAATGPAPRRARRRILLDREIDGRGEPTPVIAVEHEEPVEQRAGTTPWRQFLTSAPEPPDVPVTRP